MMSKKLSILLLITVVVSFLTIYFLTGNNEANNENKIVFIENTRVFESFQMKKDYDRILEKDLMVESQKLDSLGKKVTAYSQDPSMSASVLELEKEKYFSVKSVFEERFQKLSKDYTAQVYERLNSYIQSYGKMKKIRLILGGSGQGNVMYVDKNADITDDIIAFSNKKYLDN